MKSYAIDSGTLVWSKVLGGLAEDICGDRPGFAKIILEDKRVIRVGLAGGQMTPLETAEDAAGCEPLQSPRTGPGGYLKSGILAKNGVIHPDIDGMYDAVFGKDSAL